MFDIKILEPKLIGLTVTVHDQYGGFECGYNALELTAAWLTMDNDSFFKLFGFNWVPPLYLRDRAQNMLTEAESVGWRLDPKLMRQMARKKADTQVMQAGA
jgi:hypothetical protein